MDAKKYPLLLATAAAVLGMACTAGNELEDDTPRGALMFNLTEADLVEIHDRYLAQEDIELTRAHLTAPFDCSHFDDFCAQVGREAAIDTTERQVSLALEGVSDEEMRTELDGWIDEAMSEPARARSAGARAGRQRTLSA